MITPKERELLVEAEARFKYACDALADVAICMGKLGAAFDNTKAKTEKAIGALFVARRLIERGFDDHKWEPDLLKEENKEAE
jgi:hypothetical protein